MTKSNGRTMPLPQILIALISAIGTIGVAWIGIIPTLRKDDQSKIAALESARSENKTQIETLRGDVARLNEQLGQFVADPGSTDKWIIKGTLENRSVDPPRPIRRAFVALLPLGNDQLQATTDDQGLFVFSGVPTGHYFLLINPEDHVLDHGTIEARGSIIDDIEFETTAVKYQVDRELGE